MYYLSEACKAPAEPPTPALCTPYYIHGTHTASKFFVTRRAGKVLLREIMFDARRLGKGATTHRYRRARGGCTRNAKHAQDRDPKPRRGNASPSRRPTRSTASSRVRGRRRRKSNRRRLRVCCRSTVVATSTHSRRGESRGRGCGGAWTWCAERSAQFQVSVGRSGNE